jgi:hypothetical protein
MSAHIGAMHERDHSVNPVLTRTICYIISSTAHATTHITTLKTINGTVISSVYLSLTSHQCSGRADKVDQLGFYRDLRSAEGRVVCVWCVPETRINSLC